MDTKKVFSNGPQKKGGKDSTRVILTAAGATTVGAAAGAAAAMMNSDEKVEEPVETEVQEQTTEEHAAEETTTTTAAQQTQQNNQQQSSTSEPEEIHPVGSQTNETPSTENGNDNGQTTSNTNGGEPNIIDDVDPDLIAQEITAVEVDPNDVDVADMIEIDEVGTLYTVDGSEMTAAAVHTADGGQYLMVDVDNDMTFDVITDLEGNPIVQVDSNLTFSDVEDMMDETGGELAYNPDRDEQELANGEDPEDGILDTLMGAFDDDENLLAENTEGGSDAYNDDNMNDLASDEDYEEEELYEELYEDLLADDDELLDDLV